MTESDQVKAIRERYRRSLRDKALAAAIWLEKFAGDEFGDEDLSDLAAWLHRLAGSAGMYRYDEIAASARQLMSLMGRDLNADNQFRGQLAVLVGQLQQAAQPD